MAKEEDHLDNEVALRVTLDETGLTFRAKSRAVAALDRLCGTLPDFLAAKLEGRTQRIRAKDDVIEALILAEGDAARMKLLEDPAAGKRLLGRFLADQSIKQANRDAVALEAVAALKALPPPEEDEGEDQADIDDDWLNIFASHAERASSEGLRRLWGRILSGEIRKPKTFSLTTLRVVAELDQEIAQRFQNYVKTRMKESYIPKPANLEGQVLLDLTFLEEVGLLQDVNGWLGIDLNIDQTGHTSIVNRNLAIRCKSTPEQKLRLNIIKITRVGIEIASILPVEPDDLALRAVAEDLKDASESIELGHVTAGSSDGSFSFTPFEKLK